jgi:hypothetical protein
MTSGWRPILAALLLSASIAGCARGSPPPLLSASAQRIGAAGPISATPPASSQQEAVVAMLLPTSGTEARWTQGLLRFVWAVRYQSTRACVRARGVPMPLVPPPLFVRFYALPDLDFIRRHGFSTEVRDPERHPAGPPSQAVATTQRACQQAAGQLAQDMQSTYAGLQAEWLDSLGALQADPGVEAAYRAVPRCFASHQVRASTEAAFFTVLARQRGAAAQHRLAVVYAACLAPVEKLRTAKRQAMRAGFLARHEQEVRALEATLVPQLQALSRNTGVPIVFPVS